MFWLKGSVVILTSDACIFALTVDKALAPMLKGRAPDSERFYLNSPSAADAFFSLCICSTDFRELDDAARETDL
jgi:hypothetical protein